MRQSLLMSPLLTVLKEFPGSRQRAQIEPGKLTELKGDRIQSLGKPCEGQMTRKERTWEFADGLWKIQLRAHQQVYIGSC